APTIQDLSSVSAFWHYSQQALQSGPAPYLLYPFQLVLRPFLARDAIGFFSASVPALAILVLHYVWVVRSDVAFEEASAELAGARAEQVAAAPQGKRPLSKRKRRRAPFALRPTGPPAVALLWKNLIGCGWIVTLRTWIILALAIAFPAVMFSLNNRES